MNKHILLLVTLISSLNAWGYHWGGWHSRWGHYVWDHSHPVRYNLAVVYSKLSIDDLLQEKLRLNAEWKEGHMKRVQQWEDDSAARKAAFEAQEALKREEWEDNEETLEGELSQALAEVDAQIAAREKKRVATVIKTGHTHGHHHGHKRGLVVKGRKGKKLLLVGGGNAD